MTREPIDYIERTREQYDALGYPSYRWVENDDVPPFTPLAKPLAESRVGLVASGGLYQLGQTAFHFKDDLSFRAIDVQTKPENLRVSHFAYDTTDAKADVNVVFPYQTLKDLARLGRIGSLSRRAYTFMGGIYSARKVRETLAPAIAEQLIRDEVDVAIMVPA
jgi:D-proline reductase (dithiol) PrdB